MDRFTVGDIVIAVFVEKLPGKKYAPQLKLGKEYEVKNWVKDKKGNQHIDVGLEKDVDSVTSFETGEELPGNGRWCHPNRFILKSNMA